MKKILTILVTSIIATSVFGQTKVVQGNGYNKIIVDKDLEIIAITDKKAIENCVNCREFPNLDPRIVKKKRNNETSKTCKVNCEKKIGHQSYKKFKSDQYFTVVEKVRLYEEPVDCDSVKTNKYLTKGKRFKALGYTDFGWIKTSEGWVKGYKLSPKFEYKFKKPFCPLCKDWKSL